MPFRKFRNHSWPFLSCFPQRKKNGLQTDGPTDRRTDGYIAASKNSIASTMADAFTVAVAEHLNNSIATAKQAIFSISKLRKKCSKFYFKQLLHREKSINVLQFLGGW